MSEASVTSSGNTASGVYKPHDSGLSFFLSTSGYISVVAPRFINFAFCFMSRSTIETTLAGLERFWSVELEIKFTSGLDPDAKRLPGREFSLITIHFRHPVHSNILVSPTTPKATGFLGRFHTQSREMNLNVIMALLAYLLLSSVVEDARKRSEK